jgi:hypothetical protein
MRAHSAAGASVLVMSGEEGEDDEGGGEEEGECLLGLHMGGMMGNKNGHKNKTFARITYHLQRVAYRPPTSRDT